MEQATAARVKARVVKKGIDPEERRRKQEAHVVQIRKAKQAEQLAKRRQAPADEDAGAIVPAIGAGVGAPVAQRVPPKEQLPELARAVFSGDEAAQFDATMQFRRLLSIERNPPLDDVIKMGVVQHFVQFLMRDHNPKLQFEAAWALTNIASGTTAHTRVVVDAGAVPLFVRLLDSPNDDVREQAVWALGNIAGDGPEARNMVLDAGALLPLLSHLVPTAKLSFIRNATWTLSNLCRGKPQPDFARVAPALKTLAALIQAQDVDVLTDALWALSYMSDGDNARVQAVLEAGICRRVVELLVHPALAVKTPALRTVGNVVTGDDLQTQQIIHAGALPCLLTLLTADKKTIRKESCWTISNIMAGNVEQIQAVLDANVIPVLLQLLRNGEWEVRKEACWAISNATSGGSNDQIAFLVTNGCLHPLAQMLKVEDTKIVMVALEGIENILRRGAGTKEHPVAADLNPYVTFAEEVEIPDLLLDLQNNAPQAIYNKAAQMMETYFAGGDDEEDGELDDGETLDGANPSSGEAQTWDASLAAALQAQQAAAQTAASANQFFSFGGQQAGGAGWGGVAAPTPAAFAPSAAAPPTAPLGWGQQQQQAVAPGSFNFGGAAAPPAVPGVAPQQQQQQPGAFNFGGGFRFQ